jgi:hypothetical protein
MAKHLHLSTDSSQATWNLPDDSDLDDVRLEIKNALGSGACISVDVRVGSIETPLLINGKTVAVCAVYETSMPRDPPMVLGM